MPQMVLISALIIIAFMTFVWVLSVLRKDMSIVDGFWGLGFLAVALHWFYRLEMRDSRQILFILLLAVWGIRLAVHIFYRNAGKGEDPRYVAFRNNWRENTWWVSFFKVFMLQGGLMLVISLSGLGILSENNPDLTLVNIAGIGIWLLGWIFESVSDYQLLQFKKRRKKKEEILDSGLWKFSRHPNYFGETCVWWGFFLLSLGTGYWYISILSPLLITFLLLKISGVTLLEKRYNSNDKYAAYKRQTSPFIPLPPKKI